MPKGFQFNTALDALGGLGEIGGTGASGAFEGLVEGAKLKSVLQSQAMQNQLRELEGMLLKQNIQRGQSPTSTIHGDRLLTVDPTGRTTVGNLPMTESEAARAKREEAQAQASIAAANRTTVQQQEGEALRLPINDYLKALASGDQKEIARTLGVVHATKEAFDKAQKTGTVDKPFTLGKGAVRYDASGKEIARSPYLPGAGTGPQTRVTEETSTRLIPGKEISPTNDPALFGRISQALPQVINEIAGSPNIIGWNDPGPTVRVKGYAAPVRREDIIKHAMKRAGDVDVEVRWDGREWKMIRARVPNKKETIEKTRRTGPPRRESEQSDDDED